ncbi:uncharacterized protein LOC106662065 [Cimex lectularius]|uniref:Osiris 10 n=1 Tax=Cimex lectularius TaxID=79782 RepID=A0A8I6RF73_CIMLE|nr:uncharacterized protein LOC106662065 [Cimex lectularius]
MLLPAVLLAWTATSEAVTFPKDKYNELDEFGACLRTDDPLIPCLTSGFVKTLEATREVSEINLGDGLTLMHDYEDESIPQTITGDPREARTLLDAFGLYMDRRYLLWDMSQLFPGLVMRVGPSARGSLQFLLDKRRIVDDRALSTGGLLLKRTILPVLLGVKLNVASLVPLLFAMVIILVKKALLFSKFSFLLSGLSLYRRGTFDSSSNFGGGGIGGGPAAYSAPHKHVIIDRDRPFDHRNPWFLRENEDV